MTEYLKAEYPIVWRFAFIITRMPYIIVPVVWVVATAFDKPFVSVGCVVRYKIHNEIDALKRIILLNKDILKTVH